MHHSRFVLCCQSCGKVWEGTQLSGGRSGKKVVKQMLENEPESHQKKRQCFKTTTTTSPTTITITEIWQLLNTGIQLHVPTKNEWENIQTRVQS